MMAIEGCVKFSIGHCLFLFLFFKHIKFLIISPLVTLSEKVTSYGNNIH